MELSGTRDRFQAVEEPAFRQRTLLDSSRSGSHQARSPGQSARAARRLVWLPGATLEAEVWLQGHVLDEQRSAFALRRRGFPARREFLVGTEKKKLNDPKVFDNLDETCHCRYSLSPHTANSQVSTFFNQYWIHRYDALIARQAAIYRVDPDLVWSMIYEETYFSPWKTAKTARLV